MERLKRLKALEADNGDDASKVIAKIKASGDYIKFFDGDLFPDEPVDSNHPINARTEEISVRSIIWDVYPRWG